MPKISNHILEIPSSPIRKLSSLAQEAKDKGTKVFHLNIGQPDLDTPVEIRNSIKNHDFLRWPYTPAEGTLEFRSAISQFYLRRFYVDIAPEDIVITTGASEAFDLAYTAILNVDDEIIVPEPFYTNYHAVALSIGAKLRTVTSRIENNFALPDVKEIEEKINPRTKAILICNPNNPTGYVYSEEELQNIKKLAVKHDLYFIIDEAYRDLVYTEQQYQCLLADRELDEHLIILDSLSKIYSACGTRIGMLISRNKALTEEVIKLAQYRLSPPFLGQKAGIAAMNLSDNYYQNLRNIYKTRRDILIDNISKIEGVQYSVPNGAFYVMAQLPVDSAENFCSWLLDSFNYNGQTIMLSPAGGFYLNSDLGKKQVRIAYVLNEEEIIQAMNILDIALQEYAKSHREQKHANVLL